MRVCFSLKLRREQDQPTHHHRQRQYWPSTSRQITLSIVIYVIVIRSHNGKPPKWPISCLDNSLICLQFRLCLMAFTVSQTLFSCLEQTRKLSKNIPFRHQENIKSLETTINRFTCKKASLWLLHTSSNKSSKNGIPFTPEPGKKLRWHHLFSCYFITKIPKIRY